jgi:dienelactone hydrolase
VFEPSSRSKSSSNANTPAPENSAGSADLGASTSTASVADLPDGFVPAGFSLGCVLAVHVATQRKVSGVLMIAGAIPVSASGDDVRWPAGVPAQTHSTLADPWRDQEELDQTVRDVEAGSGTIEVFDYPGSGHLFTDPTLPDEYDPVITETFWSRALPFVRACGLSFRS